MEIDSKQKAELEKLMALGQSTVAVQQILHNFRIKRIITASNWILAGAGAFIFSILVDPEKFISSYGDYQTKISVLLFGASFFFGLLNVISASMAAALDESATFRDIIKSNLDAKVILGLDRIDSNSTHGQKFKPEESAGKRIAYYLCTYLKGTSHFWFQILSFLLGLGILGGTFLWSIH